MKGQNGILRSRKHAKLEGVDLHENMLSYTFSNEDMKANDILSVSFFLTKLDKCQEYSFTYLTDKHLNEVIKGIVTRNSGLTRIGSQLKWVNYLKNYDIEIIKASDVVKDPKVTTFTVVYTYKKENAIN